MIGIRLIGYRVTIPFLSKPIYLPADQINWLIMFAIGLSFTMVFLIDVLKKKRELKKNPNHNFNNNHRVLKKSFCPLYFHYLHLLFLSNSIVYWRLVKASYNFLYFYHKSWSGMEVRKNYNTWQVLLQLYHLPKRAPAVFFFNWGIFLAPIFFFKFVTMICFFILIIYRLVQFWGNWYLNSIIIQNLKAIENEQNNISNNRWSFCRFFAFKKLFISSY